MALQNSPNIYASRIQGHLQLSASTTASAQLNLITGTAPTAPVAGDIYRDSNHVVSFTNLKIGPETSNFNKQFNIIGTVSSGGSVAGNVENLSTSGFSLWMALQSQSAYGFLGFYNSSYSGNILGTSIPYASNTVVAASNSAAIGSGPISRIGSTHYTISGSTATNYGTRLDATGLRIGQISTLHTANTVAFAVTSGSILFGGLSGTGTRTLEVDSSGNVSASTTSTGTNAAAKIYAFTNFT